ncbi:hypothetical protein [Calothrix sp. PCC 7507]|nr:hypothetical protein [Calothrix sp. PCC 7507]
MRQKILSLLKNTYWLTPFLIKKDSGSDWHFASHALNVALTASLEEV